MNNDVGSLKFVALSIFYYIIFFVFMYIITYILGTLKSGAEIFNSAVYVFPIIWGGLYTFFIIKYDRYEDYKNKIDEMSIYKSAWESCVYIMKIRNLYTD